jgi:hypothetical protein
MAWTIEIKNVQVLGVITCLLAFLLSGCIGPKQFSGIYHNGNLPFVIDHKCIKKSLRSLQDVTNIVYEEKHLNYQDQKQELHIYTYHNVGDIYPKIFTVTIRNNTTSSISHGFRTEDYYWSGGDTETLNKERIFVRNAEKAASRVCNLPGGLEFFK